MSPEEEVAIENLNASPIVVNRLTETMREIGSPIPPQLTDPSIPSATRNTLITFHALRTYSQLMDNRKEEFKNTVLLPFLGGNQQLMADVIQEWEASNA
jgi:hypothetical protein